MTSKQQKTKAKKSAPKKEQQKPRAVARSKGVAAAYTHPMGVRGLPNMSLTLSYVAGFVRVGSTATFGLNDGVYFESASTTGLAGQVAGTGARCWMAIAPSDPNVGQTYMRDVSKYFSRKRVSRLRMQLVSLNPSTANGCIVTLAATRGSGLAQQGMLSAPALAVVAATSADVTTLPERNRIDAASYETKSIDITHLIAGGSGSKQNEFDINNDGAGSTLYTALGASPSVDTLGVVPACFIVGGTNTTVALRGTRTHEVVIEETFDLFDFIGTNALIAPVGVAATRPTPSVADRVRELQDEIATLSKFS